MYTKKVKVYYRIKGSLRGGRLGINHLEMQPYNFDIPSKHYISIYLHRIWDGAKKSFQCYQDIYRPQGLTTKKLFDKLLSEVLSHEELHRVIYQLEGWDATKTLDAICGELKHWELDNIGDGLGGYGRKLKRRKFE